MRENYRNSIASIKKFPQFTTMNVIDGQAGLIICASLIFYSLTIDNILNIIVILILAGISISMLAGDNGILQKATEAKTRTERQNIVEQARTDVLGYQTENQGGDIDKSQLKSVLDTYFKDVPTELPDGDALKNLQLTTLDKYGTYQIKVSEIYAGNITSRDINLTIGQSYSDDMIGRKITYESDNGESNWIILGKDKNGDILITTANSVGGLHKLDLTLDNWCYYKYILDYKCSEYIGKIGKNKILAKEARSITIDDINNAVQFTLPETFDNVTFGVDNSFYYPNETNCTWIESSTNNTWTHENDYYIYQNIYGEYKYSSTKKNKESLSSDNLKKPENMKYILVNRRLLDCIKIYKCQIF